MFTLTPTFIANGFYQGTMSADMVTDLGFALNFTQFLIGALWVSQVVRADGGQLPSWGKNVGNAQAYGSAAVLLAFYFGSNWRSIVRSGTCTFLELFYTHLFIFGSI